MKNGWWEHTPEWKRRRERLAEAHERFREKGRYLDQLEDQGIVRGQMWEHANRQFRDAGHKVTRLHRELWDWERKMGRPRAPKASNQHAARVKLNENRKGPS